MNAIVNTTTSLNMNEVAAKLNAGTLADVLDGYGVNGVLHHRVTKLSGETKNVLAQAVTVRWERVRKGKSIIDKQSSTWEQVKDFLVPQVRDGSGKIYVAGGHQFIDNMALAGGLSCTHFQNINFEAVVLGGAVRDAQILEKLTLPVLASNYSPADTQGSYRVAEIHTYCDIDDVRIFENDWIFIDQTGVIVIPQAISEQVFADALAIESVEDNMVERLNRGEHLFDIVEKSERI